MTCRRLPAHVPITTQPHSHTATRPLCWPHSQGCTSPSPVPATLTKYPHPPPGWSTPWPAPPTTPCPASPPSLPPRHCTGLGLRTSCAHPSPWGMALRRASCAPKPLLVSSELCVLSPGHCSPRGASRGPLPQPTWGKDPGNTTGRRQAVRRLQAWPVSVKGNTRDPVERPSFHTS